MCRMKDSDVEWIREIPEEWSSIKVKYLCNIDQKKLSENTDGDYSFNYIDISSVTEYGGIGETQEMDFAHSPSRARMIANCGDVIVSTVRTYLKAIAFIYESNNYICSTGFCVITPEKILNKFMYYTCLCDYFIHLVISKSTGISYPAISSYKISNIKLVIPNLKIRQQQIVDYLDQKCSDILSIIKSKEDIIEKLNEYRQSIISEAVTRGLDKTVMMKDSGVEWIEEIPEGWEIKKLRYLFSFKSGLTITRSELIDYGIPCINYGEIHSKYGFDFDIARDEIKCADESLLDSNPYSIVTEGDFIFCDTSEDITGSGNCVYISNSNGRQIFAGSHTIIAKPTINVSSRYLAYLFGTPGWRKQIRGVVYGIKVYSITQGIIKSASALLPPINIQNDICNYLDYKCSEINSIISANKKTIEKLKEYRQSIIYEAVTGKMEVSENWNKE